MIPTPQVIFEDDDLLVINKPAGWVVNIADSSRGLATVQKWLIDSFNYPLAQSWELRSGIVHRLDKETSGVLVVAKNEKAFLFLQELGSEVEKGKNCLRIFGTQTCFHLSR